MLSLRISVNIWTAAEAKQYEQFFQLSGRAKRCREEFGDAYMYSSPDYRSAAVNLSVPQIWLVSFLEYDLGYFDKERDRVEPGPSPFMPDKVLTMCPVNTLSCLAPPEGFEPPTTWFEVSLLDRK